MKLHTVVVAGASTLATTFLTSILLARFADQAMDKTGIGDLEIWKTYNAWSSFAFWSSVAIWLFLLGLGLLREDPERSQLLSVCGLSFLLAQVIWIVAILIV